MRSIIAGEIPTARKETPSRLTELIEFEQAAIGRWETRVRTLPPNAPPRFPDGHLDVGIAIEGEFNVQSLRDLRQTIEAAVRNHSGWPPFLTVNRVPFAPVPIDEAVEFWRGPDIDGSYDIPVHHDFWRISPLGLLFTRMGFREDCGFAGLEPAKYLDITSPTWRLGEAILEGAYIANALGAVDANLICHCRWRGLSGRLLVSRGNRDRLMLNEYRAAQDTYEATQTVALDALPQALPELVFAILGPLYELFDFFQLSKRLVEQELASLQRNTFPR
jgi:hypothetical protein